MQQQLLLFPLILFLFFSCADQEEKQFAQSSTDQTSISPSETVDQLAVSLIDENAFNALKKKQLGNILVINVWATWCVPCKEEFPDLIKLAEAYKDSDVTLFGISVDYPDETETKVIPFLKKQQANFPNYVQNFKRQEDLINLMNPEWRGAVPATFIYDKNGRQQSFLLGKHSFAEFQNAIDKMRN